jgi:small subunit ribosomal protein S6
MDFRRYETLILLSPNMGPELIEAFKAKVEGIVAAAKGGIVRFEEWGRRRLAYPVNKETHGYYVLWDYRAEPATAAEIERNCKIDEKVFKYLTLALESNFTEERLQQTIENLAKEASRRDKERESASEDPKSDFDDSEDSDYSGGQSSDQGDDSGDDEADDPALSN